MMNTDTIIRRLDELGITMTAQGDRLDLRPGSRVPQELQDAIKVRKLDLMDRLPHDPAVDVELAEIVRQVWDRGFVLLWSKVLQDTVAFTRTFDDAKHVPIAFTVYTLDEFLEVFGGELPSIGALKLIHQAKKYGGRIIGEG